MLRDDDARRARGGDGDIAGEVKTLKVLKKRRSHRERGRIGTSLITGEARAARAVAVANIARAQLARWMTRRRETPAIRYFYPAAEYCVRESSLCPMGKQSRRRDRHRARAREQNEKKRKHVRARSSPNVVRVGNAHVRSTTRIRPRLARTPPQQQGTSQPPAPSPCKRSRPRASPRRPRGIAPSPSPRARDAASSRRSRPRGERARRRARRVSSSTRGMSSK